MMTGASGPLGRAGTADAQATVPTGGVGAKRSRSARSKSITADFLLGKSHGGRLASGREGEKNVELLM